MLPFIDVVDMCVSEADRIKMEIEKKKNSIRDKAIYSHSSIWIDCSEAGRGVV
jgi:hypothetical protein